MENQNSIFNLNRTQLMDFIQLTIKQTHPQEVAIMNRRASHVKNMLTLINSSNSDTPSLGTATTVDEYRQLAALTFENFRDCFLSIEKDLDNLETSLYSEVHETLRKKGHLYTKIEPGTFHESTIMTFLILIKKFIIEIKQEILSFKLTPSEIENKLNEKRKKCEDIGMKHSDNLILAFQKTDYFDLEGSISTVSNTNDLENSYHSLLELVYYNSLKCYINDFSKFIKNYKNCFDNFPDRETCMYYRKKDKHPSQLELMKNLNLKKLTHKKRQVLTQDILGRISAIKHSDFKLFLSSEIKKWNENHEDYLIYKPTIDDLNISDDYLTGIFLYPSKNFEFHKKNYFSKLTDSPYKKNDTLKSPDGLNCALTLSFTLIKEGRENYDNKLQEVFKKYSLGGATFTKDGVKVYFRNGKNKLYIDDIMKEFEKFNEPMIEHLQQIELEKNRENNEANLIDCFPPKYREIKEGSLKRTENLVLIYKMLEDGRADNWKEAVNLVINDQFKKDMLISLDLVGNKIDSATKQIVLAGKELHNNIIKNLHEMNYRLDNQNRVINSKLNVANAAIGVMAKQSETTNDLLNDLQEDTANISRKTAVISRDTANISQVFNYLRNQ